MGFLSGLFGKKDKAPSRELNHPNQLLKGDMITLDDSFALPAQLRGQQFKVEAIHTYEYQRSCQYEFMLMGQHPSPIFMTCIIDDESYLSFSIKVTRAEVEQLFDLDEFATVFDDEDAVLNRLTISDELDNQYGQWLASEYHQTEHAIFGYFHREDYRNLTPPQDEHGKRGEAFESYSLEDNSESHGVDICVYESGDTEVTLTLYRPLTDIRQYWPGS